jgi:hypothetical protein
VCLSNYLHSNCFNTSTAQTRPNIIFPPSHLGAGEEEEEEEEEEENCRKAIFSYYASNPPHKFLRLVTPYNLHVSLQKNANGRCGW